MVVWFPVYCSEPSAASMRPRQCPYCIVYGLYVGLAALSSTCKPVVLLSPLHPWRSLASFRDPVDGVLSQCSMASSNGLVQRSGARFRRVQRGPSPFGESQRPKRTLTASVRGAYRGSFSVRGGIRSGSSMWAMEAGWVASSASKLYGRWDYAAVGTAAIISCSAWSVGAVEHTPAIRRLGVPFST